MQTAYLEVSTEDQLYVLSEALDTFLESCNPKHWRAVEAANDLISELKAMRENLSTPET